MTSQTKKKLPGYIGLSNRLLFESEFEVSEGESDPGIPDKAP